MFNYTGGKKYMRSTTIKSNDGSININLGSETLIIGRVMELGIVLQDLIYEVEFSYDELVSFLKEFHLYEKHKGELNSSLRYIVTSYDW